jgi:predicted GNAT family N-acyltransferase
MSTIHFSIAQSKNQLEAVHKMRMEIFVDEQGIPEELDNDGLDPKSIHVLAYTEDGKAAASGRLTIQDENGILSRIAVAKEFRGINLGKGIVKKLEEVAIEKNVKRLSLSPHAYLEKFYADLGYTTELGQKMVGAYPLLTMSKKL